MTLNYTTKRLLQFTIHRFRDKFIRRSVIFHWISILWVAVRFDETVLTNLQISLINIITIVRISSFRTIDASLVSSDY